MLSDCSALTDSLSGHNLLDDAALNETVRNLAPRFADPKELAEELVRRGWLTPFQKELILAGRAEELVLGKYVLIDKIGEGGMGAVYKARHRVLKAVRAIKVIRPDRLASPVAVERFYREAEVVAKLHHPNIILAHDADKHGNVHYFVMEYAPGADLGQLLLRCGPLPVADACAYIRQAALGLEHARERGLIHRDIKPSNLLVTQDGQVKLLDLGLARVCAVEEESPSSVPLTQDGAVMGTPDYMAPEQAEDSRRVDIRADIYSLGCTLYHILSGRPPYPGGSVMEKLIKHRLEDPRPLDLMRNDLPPGLTPVIRKMMAKSAKDRYQTPAEVAAALEPFCASAVRAGPSGFMNISQPPELAGTLIPGIIADMPAGITVLPGSPMEHTDPGHRAEDAPTATSPAFPLRGSTERLPDGAGLQPTMLPGGGEAHGLPTRMGRAELTAYQATQLASQSGGSTTIPLAVPPRRRGPLVAVVALVALGAAAVGAFFVASGLSPGRRDTDERRSETQPVTPPGTNSLKEDKPAPAAAKTDSKVEPVPPIPAPPPVGTPPPGPPAKAEAKALTGDRNDLSTPRTRGPAVRTGGRGQTWARRRELFALSPHKGRLAAFAADGRRVVFSTPADNLLAFGLRDAQLVTTSLAELTGNLTDGVSHIKAVALSPDGNRVLLATMARSEKPLDGNPVTTRFDTVVSWEANSTPEILYGPRIGIAPTFGSLACSPDGKEVLVAGAMPQIYRCRFGSRDLRAGRRYFKLPPDELVTAMAYSSDGVLVAAAGKDRLVSVFNTTKPDSEPLTTLSGLDTAALSVALSSSGLHALAGGRDGRACLWDVGDRPAATITKPARTLQWHDKESSVTAVAFAPSGRVFVTGADDGTLCLGEVGKDQPAWTEAPRPGGGAILALTVSPDGRYVLVADESGLGEYPLVRDIVAKNKPGATVADAEFALAEGK
jgi:serine/threonine protein kinase/WD40 repeat protein